MQKALIKRLADYAAFAGSIICLMNKADAEVIYTDIDPDVVLTTDGNYYAIDIDNNGTPDFQFLKSTFSINPSFSYYYYFRELAAGPFYQNAIAGNSHFYPYPGVLDFFPYAISYNKVIDSGLLWQTGSLQFMACKTWTSIYDNHCSNCYWNTKSLYEVLDHYIAIRFIDNENKNHYGWIRCDVREDGGLLVIKDFAYETEPDYLILAGSKTTFQEIKPGNIKGEIYTSGNTVYISVPRRPTMEFSINIYNLTGQIIYSAQSENPFIEIHLDVPHGIYVVVVNSGNAKLSKKVLIE